MLYESDSRKIADLAEAMQNLQQVIPLRSGEGYVLHDRFWLHGRLAPSGGVTSKRVHRLVFKEKRSPERQNLDL